jgi:uncharacterized membrane protein YhaH (DUF805 family)
VTSAGYLGGLIIWSYVRLFRKTFSSSSFITAQRRAIDRVLKSDRLNAGTLLGGNFPSTDLEEYNYNQATQLALKISTGVMINRVLYLWAYQVDRYRREFSPAVVFNGLSFVWLFLGTITGITLVNYALFNLDPSQFTPDSGSSLLAFALYSFGTLYLQDAGGVHAIGGVAQALQLMTALLGLVVVAGFIINVAVTARRERDENDLRDVVTDLKRRAREQEAAFRDEYAVSVEEAYRRLSDLQAGFAFLLKYFITAIPEDFVERG